MTEVENSAQQRRLSVMAIFLRVWLGFALLITMFAFIAGVFNLDKLDVRSANQVIGAVTVRRWDVLVLVVLCALPSAIVALVAKIGRMEK